MKLLCVTVFLSLLLAGLACTSENKADCAAPAPLNPNGDSELALLMRDMFDDAMRMKKQLQKGEQPVVQKKFTAIRSAEATVPEKAETTIYKVHAETHLATLEALQNAELADAPNLYHNMVESCMNCHRAMCPGPMVRIKKLYLEQ